MSIQFGLSHFWQQADAVIQGTAIVLFLMSVASWMIILSRFVAQLRLNRAVERAAVSFWAAPDTESALAALAANDKSGLFTSLAQAGIAAAHAHRRHEGGIGAGVSLSEFVTRALRQRITRAQAQIEAGLTFLASVGATAPFVGLFGTVWGIYHALVGLAGASTVVLEKVAGPVGEALIMTAAGLFVAIPAVLAYNALVRANRLVLAELDGFAHDLHAWLVTGERWQG
ncbi:MAG: MotA/TolQ/ExbB proton channel family protein [Rhodocyclaceae bacterium]|nr:MotA/TolQ/ExbB proton channel family protein [Rhodocyclaceae bacterium]